MSGADHERDSRLKGIEARLLQVERRLGLSPPPIPKFPLTSREEATEERVKRLPDWIKPDVAASFRPDPVVGPLMNPGLAPSDPKAADDWWAESERQARVQEAPSTHFAPPTIPSAPPVAPIDRSASAPPVLRAAQATTTVAPRQAAANKDGFSLERLIGAKFFMAIGAIILVIGVFLFLKLAMDRGWLSLPPTARCMVAAAFGLGLLGLGELARRKINAMASAGLFGAGVATLYGAVLAAKNLYHLVPDSVAFGMLVFVAVIGVAVALHARLVSVAILSAVGAYLAPMLIRPVAPSPYVLPVYLLALLGSGLVLSWWRPTPFRAVRGVVWWGTVLLGAAAVGQTVVDKVALVGLVFLGLAWAMIHAELYFGSRRQPHAVGEMSEKTRSPIRAVLPMITSFGTTAWAVVAGVIAVKAAGVSVALPDWTVPAAGAAAALVLSMILAGNLRLLRDPPASDAERLGAALMMQGGALVIAALALGLVGWAQVTAGLAMGVAAVGAGRWIKSRPLDVYGIVVLVLSTAKLITWESWNLPRPGAGGLVLGLALGNWSILMALGGAAWIGAGVLLLRMGGWRWMAVAGLSLGLWVVFGATIALEAQAVSMLAAFVLLGAALLGTGVGVRASSMIVQAMVALVVGTALSMVLAYAQPESALWPWRIGPVVVSRWGMVMLFAACVWAAAAIVCLGRERLAAEWRGVAAGCAAAGFVAVLLSVLPPNAAWGWVCMIWMVAALAVVGLHRVEPRLMLDRVGLVGLTAAAFAWALHFPGDWSSSNTAIGLHPGLITGVVIAVAMIGAWKYLAAGPAATRALRPDHARADLVFALLIVFIATSLEVRRGAMLLTDRTAQGAAVSIWWGLFGAAMIVLGFARRVPVMRHAGLGLIMVATGKTLLFGLGDVSQEWRVVSFLGLGLLMLAVAIAYVRVSARLAAAERAAEATSDEEGSTAESGVGNPQPPPIPDSHP